MNLVILFSLAFVFCSLNQIFQEKTVHKYGFKKHGVVKFVQMAFFTLLIMGIGRLIGGQAEIFKYKFEFNYYVLGLILAQGVLGFFVTWLFNKLLEKTEIYSLGLIMKMNIIIVLLIDYFKGDVNITFMMLGYIIMFLIGIFIVLDIHTLKGHHFKEDLKYIEYILAIFVVGIISPYLIKLSLDTGTINAETVSLFSTSIIAMMFVVVFKIKIDKESFIEYIPQSLSAVISGVAINNIIAEYGVFYSVLITTSVIIGVTILSSVVLKDKISFRKYTGVVIAAIGFFLISINL
ncbi:MAG: hypothetical protein N4A47_07405 [Clostridia bacterium]|jgi:drug/metabolite transporter (DMT)-like permease|nr:hypothetical protein [Clostridia bacterium]